MPLSTKLVALALSLSLSSGLAVADDRTAELQTLLNRAAEHLRLRTESNVANKGEIRRRYALLQQAMVAWNKSAKSDADATQMRDWLAEAAKANRLGSRRAMPALPELQPKPQPSATINRSRAPEVVEAPVVSSVPSVLLPKRADTPRRNDTKPQMVQRVERTAPVPVAPSAPAPVARPAVAPRAWSSHPAASELEWGDPFADDTPRVAASDSDRRMKPVIPAKNVSVNVSELFSRVDGYNAGIQQLEGLMIGSRNLTAFRLASMVRELEDLESERGFLKLYLGGLTKEEAPLRPELDSADSLAKMLRKAVKRRTEQLESSSGRQASAEREILKSLARRLGVTEG